MFKFIQKRTVVIFCFIHFLLQSSMVYSQQAAGEGAPGAQSTQSSSMLDDTLKDLSIVMATGVGGAILGLSTLSFSDNPKERLSNILVGGAIGVILGVGIVAWKQATKSQEVYNQQFDEEASLNLHKDYFENIRFDNNEQQTMETAHLKTKVRMLLPLTWKINF